MLWKATTRTPMVTTKPTTRLIPLPSTESLLLASGEPAAEV